MNRSKIRWLYQETPQWVKEGIISEETAERLRDRYGPAEVNNRNALAMTIFAGLGAVAIGLGFIMLIAHNWDELGRGARTVISFAPLLLAQGLAAWTLAFRQNSTAWREGSGAALALAIGACISLISQTYHLSGDTKQFLLTWMLLGAPIIYLLRVNLPALMYFLGLAIWPFAADPYSLEGMQEMVFVYWGLATVIAPYIFYHTIRHPDKLGTAWLSWAFCLSITIAWFGKAAAAMNTQLAFLGLFTTFILCDRLMDSSSRGLFYRPFAIVGMVGMLITALLLSHEMFWYSGAYFMPSLYNQSWGLLQLQEGLLLTTFICAGTCLATLGIQQNRLHDAIIGLAPLLTASILTGNSLFFLYQERSELYQSLPTFHEPVLLPLLFFNAFLLALGLTYVASGIKTLRMGHLNMGMFILGALILFRFMDAGFGLVERGIAFILLGVFFLGINVYVVRKSRRIEEGVS